MAWWEWLIVLGLWAWTMIDVELLRQGVDEGLRLVDGRRITSARELRYNLEEMERKQRRL